MAIKRFGYRTISAIKDILSAIHTNSSLESFFFTYGLLDLYRSTGVQWKAKNTMEVFNTLSKGGEDELSILSEIITDTLKELYSVEFTSKYPELIRSLAQDGFTLNEEGELIPIISPTIDPKKEEGLLETILNQYDLNVAKNHLDQAYDNYVQGNWESSNASLRSFLQEVFDQISLQLWPEEASKKKAGGERRKLLQEKSFIEDEIEAGLVKSFFDFASYKGSHPGISDESDCRMRRYMAVALASYYLEKLRSINIAHQTI